MSSRKALLIVTVLVFSAGVTPIAIRITQGEGMPSLIIVLIRLWLVSAGLTPLVLSRYRSQIRRLSMRQWLLGLIAGFWLASNLFMLFLALEYTSVLVTGVLRRTTPVWIILPEVFILGTVFSRRTWFSMILSLAGVLLITVGGGDTASAGSRPLLGAIVACFGAISFGIYLLIGRRLNDEMPSLLYSWIVFIGAACVTSVLVSITRTPVLGYPTSGYIWTLIVTFLAQILGHIVINIGLQYFTATAMAVILQLGVVVSGVIALFAFDEIPSTLQIAGSVIVIIGVIITTTEQTQMHRKKQGIGVRLEGVSDANR